jgi:hypothetical protein
MITRNLQRETHKETHKARARRLILIETGDRRMAEIAYQPGGAIIRWSI